MIVTKGTAYVIFEITSKRFIKYGYLGLVNLTDDLSLAAIYHEHNKGQAIEDCDLLNIQTKTIKNVAVQNIITTFKIDPRKLKYQVVTVGMIFDESSSMIIRSHSIPLIVRK